MHYFLICLCFLILCCKSHRVIADQPLLLLYNIEFKDKMYFCGGLDHIGLINEIKHFGIEPDKYMNSGIMLINFKL